MLILLVSAHLGETKRVMIVKIDMRFSKTEWFVKRRTYFIRYGTPRTSLLTAKRRTYWDPTHISC